MSYDLKHIRQAINIKTNGQDAYNNEPSIIENITKFYLNLKVII